MAALGACWRPVAARAMARAAVRAGARCQPSAGRCPVVASAREGSSLARAVRPVPIRVLTITKKNSKGAALMADEYAAKVKNYAKFEEVQIRPNPKNSSNPEVQKAAEGERVLKLLTPTDYVVVLDERGKDVTSEGMAKLIADAGDNGFGGIVFCIGGPFGHSEEVRQRSTKMIRLSKMVLNHQVAHVVLMEQIYRGWTILRGEPYHH
mmetsp:Transcript_21651/g.54504  ORF Transcript_21651/g.54504 Transcript_21651/m.54504 type:complete len:208 (-) Transcript_21651:202-825(-)|eukprot:jgi/Tetstr1/431665/TSEL_021194.t1